VLEQRALQTVGLLTERTRRTVWQPSTASRGMWPPANPASWCLDTFYIGQPQGGGKVWQITACDATCSYGVAWLLPPAPPGPASGLSSREHTTFGL
jgi:hypothetical protein